MRSALSVPNFGRFGDVDRLVELALVAEEADWDGVFVWDHISSTSMAGPGEDPPPAVDAWTALAVIAARTSRIRLGPLVTPLPRRRPHVVARQAATVDHISGGRLILGVGLGTPPETEYAAFGEDPSPTVRARKLDEALEIITGLWTAEPFSFEGRYHRVHEATFVPAPAQHPRIPIWCAATWPNRNPVRRAARFDGIYPISVRYDEGVELTPQEIANIRDLVYETRSEGEPFDIVVGSDASPEEMVAFAEAGATWWIQPRYALEDIAAGPAAV